MQEAGTKPSTRTGTCSKTPPMLHSCAMQHLGLAAGGTKRLDWAGGCPGLAPGIQSCAPPEQSLPPRSAASMPSSMFAAGVVRNPVARGVHRALQGQAAQCPAWGKAASTAHRLLSRFQVVSVAGGCTSRRRSELGHHHGPREKVVDWFHLKVQYAVLLPAD